MAQFAAGVGVEGKGAVQRAAVRGVLRAGAARRCVEMPLGGGQRASHGDTLCTCMALLGAGLVHGCGAAAGAGQSMCACLTRDLASDGKPGAI